MRGEDKVKCKYCGREFDFEDATENKIAVFFGNDGDGKWSESGFDFSDYADIFSDHFYDADGCVCKECFEKNVNIQDALLISVWRRNTSALCPPPSLSMAARQAAELYEKSVISYLYSMEDLLELARKDIKERLSINYEPDISKMKRQVKRWAEDHATNYEEGYEYLHGEVKNEVQKSEG